MRKVTVAAVQMRCTENAEGNIARAEALVRKAAAEGAQIILLPELFERPYFCQERRYEYYGYAKPVEENDAVRHFSKVAKELSVVLPISFYERDKNRLFNTVAILDADGENLGIYRKTHIPDDHYYQEKFYFTPGDTGFKAFKTRYGCHRRRHLLGPVVPGDGQVHGRKGRRAAYSTPRPSAVSRSWRCDSMPHWRRCMQGHSACNLMPVIAANRVGLETVEPCAENGDQSSSLRFYGSSFITDGTGELVTSMDRDSEGVITASFDLDALAEDRLSWGLFRDRRPELYKE